MSVVAGNLILDTYTVLDLNDAPLTGMTVPTDVALTLYRQSGVTMVAASETISWVEIGASGTYYFSFAPTGSGLYMLRLVELNVNTGQRQWAFRYEVLAAGAGFAPSYANAFCAETDVERYLSKAIDSTTDPNDTETAGFAQGRAAILQSLCASLGFAITPGTVTAGSRMEGLLREANAIGAALNFELAQQLRVSPNRSERIDYFLGMWQQYYGQGPFAGTPGSKPAGPGYIEVEITGNLVSLATDHILSGDTIAAAPTYPTDTGPLVSMRDVY